MIKIPHNPDEVASSLEHDKCRNCQLCMYCYKCVDCVKCVDCDNCSNCVGCTGCSNCIGCKNIQNQNGLINVRVNPAPTEANGPLKALGVNIESKTKKEPTLRTVDIFGQREMKEWVVGDDDDGKGRKRGNSSRNSSRNGNVNKNRNSNVCDSGMMKGSMKGMNNMCGQCGMKEWTSKKKKW